MGSSYAQMVVGGMLLVIAFFFGRYINQQPMSAKKPGQAMELPAEFDSSSAAPAKPNGVVAENVEQQSLRERILSQRAHAKATNLNEDRGADSRQSIERPNFAETIVEPDFSHLQSFESAGAQFPGKLPVPGPAAAMPKTDTTTQPDQGQAIGGRFSINRTTQNRSGRQPSQQPNDATATRPTHHSVDNKNPNRNRSPEYAGNELVVDNPRYRMVPVRERIGNWDPEPRDYVNYTTVFGDTLHSLSTKFFGTPNRYLDIYLANHQVIPSPSEVPVNTEIRIPVMK